MSWQGRSSSASLRDADGLWQRAASDWNEVNAASDFTHQFLRIKGGFITVSVEGTDVSPKMLVQHHDVEGQIVHQAVFNR